MRPARRWSDAAEPSQPGRAAKQEERQVSEKKSAPSDERRRGERRQQPAQTLSPEEERRKTDRRTPEGNAKPGA